jgi:mono/diheme cytochrome c family protein
VDDFRKIAYGTLIVFVLVIAGWVSFVTFSGCGYSLNCASAAPTLELTSIPTLIPATLPPLDRQLGAANVAAEATGTQAGGGGAEPEATEEVARPSNPGGPGAAVGLTGDATSGQQIYSANCAVCHGADGKGGVANPGSADGTVPALNPIDPTLVSSDPKTYATNLDLFLEHGSTAEGNNPTFAMPAWGDKSLLAQQQIADVIAYIISLNPAPAAGAATPVAAAPTAAGTQAEPEATEEVARPSNAGGPGAAVGLTGDAKSGQQIYSANCAVCHGPDGTGGVANPGSADGTVPALNPIDSTLISSDPKTYATNLDLFLEHGSTAEGNNPTFAMPAWGDKNLITQQQIADVIAYIISLNPAPAAATPVAAAPKGAGTAAEPEPAEEVARPSNPGGPGAAVGLTGDATSGQQIYSADCSTCHGTDGKGGVANPGSADGTVPALNPIDPTLKSADPKTFATNLDLFLEHGSTAEGNNPTFAMPAWGDKNLITQQQIADVIAYIMSLNK